MSHNRGLHLGLGLGTNILAGESGYDPARFMHDTIDVVDNVLKQQHKLLFDSIVITERTLAGITEFEVSDSIDVTEGSVIALRIIGRSLIDTLDVSDAQVELRERTRLQSDNAAVTDNTVVT